MVESARIRTILLCLIVIVSYFNVIDGPFVFDDSIYIWDNPRIYDISTVPSLFTDIRGSLSHRPLTLATFAINFAFNGFEPRWYRIVNIMLHITAGLLLYQLIMVTATRVKANALKAQYVSFFATAIFLAHPLQTESVTYLSSRSVLLVTIFYLSAMLLYIRSVNSDKTGHWWRHVLMFCIGMLGGASRENFITILVMLPLYDYLFLSERTLHRTLRNLRLLLPLLPGMAYMLWMVHVTDAYGKTVGTEITVSSWSYFMTQWRAHWLYLRLLLWPQGQSLAHALAFEKSFQMTLLPFALGYAGLWAAGLLLLRRHALAGYCILWFMVTLTPSSSVVAIIDPVFEHRTYIPSMGFAVLIVIAVFALIPDRQRIGMRFAALGLTLCTLLLSWATIQRNVLWNDQLLLWKDALRTAPQEFRPNYNLALAYLARGMTEEAEEPLRRANALRPDAGVLYKLGAIEYNSDRTEEALTHVELSLRLDPDNAASWLLRGLVLRKLNRNDAAIEDFRKALVLDPKNSQAREALADVLKENPQP